MTDTQKAPTVDVDQKLFEEVRRQSARVDQARSEYNSAAEEAKGCKKALEGAQKTLESLIRRLTAPASDLPLFSNQTDAIAAAEADPVVTKLVDRLLGHGQDVNALMVAGYTQEERAELATWLDAMDAYAAEHAEGDEAPAPPAFLAPQDLTAIEVADLITRLKACEYDVDADGVQAWTPREVAEVKDWLSRAEAVVSAKGEDLSLDDLPTVPACLDAAMTATEARADDVAAADEDEHEDEEHDTANA